MFSKQAINMFQKPVPSNNTEIDEQYEDPCERYGLEISICKTKFMIISKWNIQGCQLFVREIPLERVSRFTYLGTAVNGKWDHL